LTHFYGNRLGVRYMSGGLKVYYLPIIPFYNKSALPTIVANLPALAHVIRSERADVVHGHSAFSTLAQEAIFIGGALDGDSRVATVFTDHSLFGFADASAVVTNTFLRFSLANADQCVCVSHVGKENTVLRSSVPSSRVSVIPNAVDCKLFRPDYQRASPSQQAEAGQKVGGNRVVVVIGSRLVYRKGIDLVAAVIPSICRKKFVSTNSGREFLVNFLIGGDGPKRLLLEETVEQFRLQSRVTLLGELAHSEVRDRLLVKGDVFLNTSLTEAFCMAIVEAVACGLTVVSTNVGGIPEVLPPELLYAVRPEVESIQRGLERAVQDVVDGRRPDATSCHEFVARAYNWKDVAERTEVVYRRALAHSVEGDLASKVRSLWEKGRVAGPAMACVFLFCHYWLKALEWLGKK